MKKYLNILIIISIFPFLIAPNVHAQKKDTPHYDVVAEYIRSLGAIHKVQEISKIEFQDVKDEDSPYKKLIDGIRSASRFKLELNTSISALKRMRLKKPFEELIPNTILFYEKKIELFDETIKISKTFLDGPKPGVDYSGMLARMPEITATVEYIDESIFQTMVLVFALLIDEKPDSEGHMSHLNISADQKQKLIDNIDGYFGESLERKNKTWTVNSASLLKAYLLKDYKCTDEWKGKQRTKKDNKTSP